MRARISWARRALRRAPEGGLSAHLALDPPALRFPATLRAVNARTGKEAGPGLTLADADALLSAAGPPSLRARFAGLHPRGLAFRVALDRVRGYGRAFDLRLDGTPVASAISVPDAEGGDQHLVFALEQALAFGTAIAVTERLFGVDVFGGTADAPMLQAVTQSRLAALEADLVALRQENARLRQRLDTALDLGRDRLMLERLDLFYLLLCERAGGPVAVARAEAPHPPTIRRFGPGDVDGIGIFDVETDGRSAWRWFGPEVTIALRGLGGPVSRVVLLFYRFAGDGEPPGVRVSTGGAAQPARMRALAGHHALDVPVPRGALVGGDMLVLHLSFDRHHTSEADVRLLSAVFSGADVTLGAG